jgi:peptidoglycan/xylan/chitin deacetylase (PgdA/CDA1 family)
MNVPCPVHEGRRAHRGCHFCRRPICRLCEVKMRGHLYCSPRCARDAGRHAVWARTRTLLSRPVPARLAVLLVALAATAPILSALHAVSVLDRLSAVPGPSSPRRSAAAATLDGVTASAGGVRLAGAAPEGTAVFLFAGGRFVAAAPVKAGRFEFAGVREPGPYRVGALPLSPELAAPAASSGLAQTGRAPLPGRFVPDLTRGPTDRREILVSFDAGSSDRGASRILDVLAERGIRTTLFLTGEFIRRYPEIARRIAAQGHEVGNHTDTHPHLTSYAGDGRQATLASVTRGSLEGELRRAAEAYRAATGAAMAPLWRAPYGEHNAEIRRWAAEAGYWHVGWTGGRAGLDGLDWVTDPASRSYRSSEELLERLAARAENGGIVLLHLGSDREDPIAARIGLLFERLAARGFRFVRASDFIERAGFPQTSLAELPARR